MVAKQTKSRTTRAVGKKPAGSDAAAAATPATVPAVAAVAPVAAPAPVAPDAVAAAPAEPVVEPVAKSAAPKPVAPAEPAAKPVAEPAAPKLAAAPQPVAPAKPPAQRKPFAANGAPSYGDVAALGRGNAAAVARANAALVGGFEAIGQEMAGFAQASMTTAVNTARALVGVRTLADLVAVNRDFAQATFEGMIANSTRLSEIGIRMASEAFAPLGERVAVSFGRGDKSAA